MRVPLAFILVCVSAGCGRTTADLGAAPDENVLTDAATAVESGRGGRVDTQRGGMGTCGWNGFGPPAAYATGVYPNEIAIDDFNGDGHPDLAISNWTSSSAGSVSVYLGQPGGAFAPQAQYLTDIEPHLVSAGDFDGDGYPDLAVINQVDDLDILINAGDGTFRPFVRARIDVAASNLTVADFNADGHLDLAISPGDSSIRVYPGGGDGSFGAPVISTTVNSTNSLTVGDVDGDGRPDLVATHAAPASPVGLPYGQLGPGSVQVFLGLGDGAFALPTTYAAGTGTVAVATGDFNDDGHLDLAATNKDEGTLSVFLNHGDGTFGVPRSYATAADVLTVGDFNGDGKPDLAAAIGTWDSGVVQLLLNGEDGTFQAPVSYAAAKRPVAMVGSDFNGDGITDLAVATYADSTVNILLSGCQ